MIISGGENIYPAEIESALLEFAEVAGGGGDRRPRPDLGRGRAGGRRSVAGNGTDPDELRERLRTRLAGFKVPKYVELTDQLPKTATGKIRKPDLRDHYVTTEENPA